MLWRAVHVTGAKFIRKLVDAFERRGDVALLIGSGLRTALGAKIFEQY